jgi:hypothetical protein
MSRFWYRKNYWLICGWSTWPQIHNFCQCNCKGPENLDIMAAIAIAWCFYCCYSISQILILRRITNKCVDRNCCQCNRRGLENLDIVAEIATACFCWCHSYATVLILRIITEKCSWCDHNCYQFGCRSRKRSHCGSNCNFSPSFKNLLNSTDGWVWLTYAFEQVKRLICFCMYP